MRRALAALAALAGLASFALAQAPPPAEIEAMLTRLSAITGFAVKRNVPGATMSRAQWKRWLERELARRVEPEEIRREELALKLFGLLPGDYDLRRSTIELLTEQAAAFYDHRTRRMVFFEGSSSPLDSALLAHELGHALADQHVRLGKFIEGKSGDDAQAARLAVVEGQAMWLMLEAPLRAAGSSLLKNSALLDTVAGMGEATGMFPVFDQAPLYLKETLLFPYRDGVRFQQAALEKLGTAAFAQVLRGAPVSTQQVIHPELWFSGAKPERPALPAWRAAGWKRLLDGDFGELDHRILFRLVDKGGAARVAAGWKGGRFELWEAKDRKRAGLRWATRWASEASAREALALYAKVLKAKWPEARVSTETDEEVAGHAAGEGFRVWRSGSSIEALERLPARK
jgi:hypothetical protein